MKRLRVIALTVATAAAPLFAAALTPVQKARNSALQDCTDLTVRMVQADKGDTEVGALRLFQEGLNICMRESDSLKGALSVGDVEVIHSATRRMFRRLVQEKLSALGAASQ